MPIENLKYNVTEPIGPCGNTALSCMLGKYMLSAAYVVHTIKVEIHK